MNPIRIAGLTCLAAAVVMLVLNIAQGLLGLRWGSTSLAEIWGMISPGSLISVQDFVQDNVSSMLWNGILLPLLTLPVWLTLLILALILIAVGRHRE
jgi:hypothetical protein